MIPCLWHTVVDLVWVSLFGELEEGEGQFSFCPGAQQVSLWPCLQLCSSCVHTRLSRCSCCSICSFMWSVLSIIEFLAFFLIYATVSWLNKCKSVMLIVLIIHQGYSYEFPWWECYTNSRVVSKLTQNAYKSKKTVFLLCKLLQLLFSDRVIISSKEVFNQ
jgi:hypothetical protein